MLLYLMMFFWLRNDELVSSDFDLVREKCCRHYMGDDLFRERGFCDKYVTHVFCKNVDVERNNLLKLPT